MKLLLQRVHHAEVSVNGITVASISKGLVGYLGIAKHDTSEMIQWMVKKVAELRIFQDSDGKLNHSVRDVQGEIIIISQFTLLANCTRGRRPDFTHAAEPELARMLYEEFIQALKTTGLSVQTGVFAAHMHVSTLNDGPINIILER